MDKQSPQLRISRCVLCERLAGVLFRPTTPAQGLSSVLGIVLTAIENHLGEHWYPDRGLDGPVPVDPVIYRLYEGVLVYGHPIKALIHEKFGDGIMSMIDCNITVKRKHHEKGDRVVLTYE